ncbi:hypothetical protein PYW08_013359 [Mythimna loreyi]|uniref:Uncharacterized protein n=1 Tax=Mythimna loreyi TaxID=667449 RepID=A0ACC2QFY6_9NEOP|nr:hypothetical protein PYW08_013359 [Mythimna loreyi]
MLHTTNSIVCGDIGAAGAPPARPSSPLRDCEHRAASVRVIEQQDSLDGRRLSANMKKGVENLQKLWTTLFQIMLSVQVPGCAGMERLGAPGGPRLRHDHRHHHSTLEWEKQQRLQAMVGRLQEMVEQETRARSAAAAERLGLPPSIQLPDGEYGPDVHLQLRVPYQQAELTRSSFQPPPNKCVSDVPEWAGGAEAGLARRGKKDGLLQKATRWWVRMGARAPAAAPPCVMVPRAPEPPPDK